MKSATSDMGLSDHHKLTAILQRKTISEGNSEKKFYKDQKKFKQKKI